MRGSWRCRRNRGLRNGRHARRLAGDEPGSPAVGHVGPGPLDHDQDSITESDQEEDVDEGPDEPREKAAEVQRPDIGHRPAAADDGKLSLVPVLKGPPWLSCEVTRDGTRSVLTHLDGNRADPRQRVTFLVSEQGRVTHYEHF